jgi:hypothetical protein
VGGGAIYRFLSSTPPDVRGAEIFGALIVLVVLLEVVNHIRSDKKRQSDRVKEAERDALRLSVEPIEAILDSLHAILVGDRTGQKHGLRICLWEPDGNGNLVQITEYAGVREKGKRGRISPVSHGIIGRIYRAKIAEITVVQRSTKPGVSFVDQMINDFGYPEEIARDLNPDREAWAAVAIGEPDSPSAVLFMDSRQREFFGSKKGCAQRAIQSACVSIARHIAHRKSPN